jgi:hypothetical protein
VQLAQLTVAHELGHREHGWKEAVVLADHQGQPPLCRKLHQRTRLGDARGEWLLDQDVLARLQGSPCHGDVAG